MDASMQGHPNRWHVYNRPCAACALLMRSCHMRAPLSYEGCLSNNCIQGVWSRGGLLENRSQQHLCQRAGACWVRAARAGRAGDKQLPAGASCGLCGGCCRRSQIRQRQARRRTCSMGAPWQATI